MRSNSLIAAITLNSRRPVAVDVSSEYNSGLYSLSTDGTDWRLAMTRVHRCGQDIIYVADGWVYVYCTYYTRYAITDIINVNEVEWVEMEREPVFDYSTLDLD
jgi:hypothetical protein